MDIDFFVSTLMRRKWLLIGASALAGAVTVLVMVQLPKEYRANAQVQTGIVDYRGVRLTRSNDFVQKFQVENAFSNMITEMTGRATLGKLAEIVLARDLDAPEPFRQPDEQALAKMGAERMAAARAMLVSEVDTVVAYTNEAPSMIPARQTSIAKLAEAYEYDWLSLRKLMDVKRLGDTDYLDISFKSENPELSYFLVSEYVKMFIEDFKRDQSSEERRELDFYVDRVRAKKREVDSLQSVVDDYRRGHTVVDLTEQQSSVVGQIANLENAIEIRRKEIAGYENALSSVTEARETASQTKVRDDATLAAANTQLQRVKQQLVELQTRLDEPGVDREALDRQIERKKADLASRIERVAQIKRLGQDRVAERVISLQERSLDASIDVSASRAAVRSMQAELGRLRARASALVDDEAYLSQLETELGILRGEYNELITNRDGAELTFTRSEHPLSVVEAPEYPEDHESRQIPLVAAFSSVAMGTILSLGLFLLALLDRRLGNPDQMRTLLGRDPLVTLPRIKTKKFSLPRLFGPEQLPEAERRWLESMRSLRYELETSGKRVVQITSLARGAGKSTVLAGLATALEKSNKRVLVVDLNFKSNTLSAYSNVPSVEHPFEMGFNEEDLPRADAWFELSQADVIGNLGGNRSLTEVLAGTDFEDRLREYAQRYDYVLLESAAMDLYSDSRELGEYVEGIVCVLDARQKVSATDRDSMAWLDAQVGKSIGFVLNRVDLKLLQ